MLALQLRLLAVVALQLSATPRLCEQRLIAPRMQLAPGGDLEGGKDNARNAEVQRLKKLFYDSKTPATSAPSPDGTTDGASVRIGVLHDLPLTRWQMCILPHQQTLLNVFQPEYIHMFESLLATRKPWLYLHVLLPGGVENLANPQYALPGLSGWPPGDGSPLEAFRSQAPLHGTLMQVVAVQRQPDARLALVVQGLRRAIVLRGTQALPYARADVQSLPDAEQLLEAAIRSRQWLRSINGLSLTGPAVRRRMAAAAAAAEEQCWRPYEYRPVETGRQLPPPFASFEPSEVSACASRAAKEVCAGLDAALLDASSAAERGGGAMEASYADCEVVRAALAQAVDSIEVVEAEGVTGAADAGVEAGAETTTTALEAAEAEMIAEAEQQLAALEVRARTACSSHARHALHTHGVLFTCTTCSLRRTTCSLHTPPTTPIPSHISLHTTAGADVARVRCLPSHARAPLGQPCPRPRPASLSAPATTRCRLAGRFRPRAEDCPAA